MTNKRINLEVFHHPRVTESAISRAKADALAAFHQSGAVSMWLDYDIDGTPLRCDVDYDNCHLSVYLTDPFFVD